MAKEYQGLAHEWASAADIPPGEEQEIKRLSREAESLVEDVRACYQRADAEAARRRAGHTNALNDLRRGRRSVNIYRPGALLNPGFIDKKA